MRTQFFALLLSFLLLPASAVAVDWKHLTYEIDAADFMEARLEISVGEVAIEVYDGDSIELDIELEAGRRWFGLRKGDVDGVEVEQRVRGESIYLGIDKDDLQQTWHVRLPAHLALELDVGVGDVEIENFSSSLRADLGVGSLRVDVSHTNYAEIVASTGVGDAVIRGFGRGINNERSLMVGADAYFAGEGEHTIEIEVGVGDAQIRAR